MNAITNRKYVTESYGGDFCGPENLWSLGISGDLPIICLEIKKELSFDDSVYRIIKAFLVAHRHFMLSGTRFDIAVLYKGTGEYFDKTRALLVEMTDRIGSPFLSSRNGGIFFVDSKNFRDSEVLRTWSSYYASLNKDTVVEKLILSQKKSSTFCVLKDQNDSVCEKEPAIQKHNVSSSTLTKTNVGETIEIPGGAFTQDGFEIRKKEVTLPWSYVYANPIFGTLLTQNSLGYTWKGNCHSKRITPWNCDGYSEASGEKMILTVGEERYDMCACADSVTYGCGFAEYVGVCGGIKFSICVGIDARLPVKMMIVRTNGGKVSYELEPLMGTDFGCVHSLQTRLENGILYFRNVKSQDFKENGFIYRIENESAIKNNGDNNENGSEICFLLGAFPDGGEAVVLRAIEKFPNSAAIRLGFAEYTKRIFSKETEFILKSDFPSFDLFVNRYLPYQTKTIRMTARGGFYQSGGAYGFRDQLQDSLAPLYFEPSLTRRQIIRCACHQYSEGDVMHWWHQKRTGPVGVRTRCSDDYLWLPYVTALYVEHTGDESVLSLSLPYVESDKLKDWELERCETPSFTKRKESLYLHCVRAIELALSRIGDRGLPLIGTGDWNDGMNMIGVEGKGESVWLGFFLCTVLHKFSGICKMMNESETAKIFEKERSLLLKSLEKNWTGDRYIRAYFDDGAPIGTDDCRCCKIDLLPQAFSALTDGVDEDKMRAALSSAKQHLYDSDVGIMKLFSPPFSRKSDEKNNPGYIQSYVPGIRENGGQYTHAAVWGAWAYFAGGYYDFATELLLKLNPAQKYLDGLDEIYRGEPYFMAGDVYSNQDYNGRAGWTLYTGAAAWYYRIILSELLGYNCFGEYFSITPKLTEKFNSFELTIRKDNTEYVIKAALGDKNEYFLDGKTTKNFFSFDKRRHILKITVEKNK